MPFGNLKVGDLIYESSGSEVTVSLASLVTNNSPAFTGTATGVNLTLSGNLTVNGTQTIINTQTLDVEDKQIEIGKVASPSDTTADQGGWKLKGATDKTFLWLNATDSWTSSEHIEIASGKNLKVDGTTFFVDGTNDRVGIGTASPTSMLHVAGAGAPQIKVQDTDTAGGYAHFKVNNAALYIESFDEDGTEGEIIFENGATEAMRLDLSGRLLVGSASARTAIGATGDPFLQVEGLAADTAHISIIRNSASAAGPYFSFVKTRGTSDGDVTIVNDGDDIGTILFCPADGVDVNQQSAFIRGEIDGTPGSNDTPGRIVFSTTADGSGTPTEALRLDSSQNATFAGDVDLADSNKIKLGNGDDLQIYHNGTNSIISNTTGALKLLLNNDEDAVVANQNGAVELYHDGSKKLETTASGVTVTGTVSDSKGDLRSIPTKLEANAYTLVAADAGKCVSCDNGCTVPNNVFAAGDIVTIINSATSDKTITQGSGLTMRNVGDDGNYGNVTVKKYAMSTIIFTHPTVCFFSTTAAA